MRYRQQARATNIFLTVAKNIARKLGVLPPSPRRQESSSSSAAVAKLAMDPLLGRLPQPQIFPHADAGRLSVLAVDPRRVSTDNDGLGTDRTDRIELWLGAGLFEREYTDGAGDDLPSILNPSPGDVNVVDNASANESCIDNCHQLAQSTLT